MYGFHCDYLIQDKLIIKKYLPFHNTSAIVSLIIYFREVENTKELFVRVYYRCKTKRIEKLTC